MWLMLNEKKEAFQIVGYNLFEAKDGTFELWVTKTTWKTYLIATGAEKEVNELFMRLEFEVIKGSSTVDLL